jgi:hypothetical protein
LTIFEGAGRKWLFPQIPYLRYAAYFSKDVLFILIAYWGLQAGRRFDLQWMVPCALLIIASSAIGTMNNSNLVGIFLSVRAYLIIPACAFLVVPLVRGFRDVERCALVVAIAAVPVAILGVRQYSLPTSHVLNRYDSGTDEARVAGHVGHTRATGTFSYIGGMATMAGISAWAGMALVFRVPCRRNWVRAVGAAAIGAGLVCAAVSMSRGALLTWGVVVGGGTLLFLNANQIVVVGLSFVAVLMALATTSHTEQIDTLVKHDSLATGLVYRIQTSNDSLVFRLQYMMMDLSTGLTKYPVGEGIGLGQQGAAYVSYGTRSSEAIESEWGRIAYEVGAAGLIGVLLVRFVPILICWRALLQTTEIHRRLILATALPFFGIMCVSNIAFNHVGSSAAWVVMALALAAVPSQNARRIT